MENNIRLAKEGAKLMDMWGYLLVVLSENEKVTILAEHGDLLTVRIGERDGVFFKIGIIMKSDLKQ